MVGGFASCCACAVSGQATVTPPRRVMNSRRLIATPEGSGQGILPTCTRSLEGSGVEPADVRFGSKADMCSAQAHVRFTPNSGHVTNRYSITSSAAICKVGGTLRRSDLAALRLMTSSNLVSRSTGRSLGLAPLRIRPT